MIFPATEPVARMIADARRQVLEEVLACCARLAEEAEAKERTLRTGNPFHEKQAQTQFGKSLGAMAVAAEVRGMLTKENDQ